MKSVVLLGAPGSGKGTMAARLKSLWNVPHISTGDMFREAVRNGSPMGLKASEFMKEGLLVPDEITIAVVDERFSKGDVRKGFLLDGFPRTISQAEALEDILTKNDATLDVVLLLNVPEELVVKRITGRRTCSICGAIFHIQNMPPKIENICDRCGGELIQRRDDTAPLVRERLITYTKQTAPLIDFYKQKDLLIDIDASLPLDQMVEQVEGLVL